MEENPLLFTFMLYADLEPLGDEMLPVKGSFISSLVELCLPTLSVEMPIKESGDKFKGSTYHGLFSCQNYKRASVAPKDDETSDVGATVRCSPSSVALVTSRWMLR
ncbi:unnamed protein product [Larinioides sclopetarius]|uniref:Uncharacterized protein n=1 Tax=Larinioides sclopetarius TaxID=280406 RepID=A0AAV2B8R4_9ARAC